MTNVSSLCDPPTAPALVWGVPRAHRPRWTHLAAREHAAALRREQRQIPTHVASWFWGFRKCACLYFLTYVFTRIYLHTYMHMDIHSDVYICLYTYSCGFPYKHTHRECVCIHTHVYLCVYSYICVCANMFCFKVEGSVRAFAGGSGQTLARGPLPVLRVSLQGALWPVLLISQAGKLRSETLGWSHDVTQVEDTGCDPPTCQSPKPYGEGQLCYSRPLPRLPSHLRLTPAPVPPRPISQL